MLRGQTGSAAIPRPNKSRLAIIAGSGRLPEIIAQSCAADQEKPVIVSLGVAAPAWAADYPAIILPFEQPSRLFASLRKMRCDRICFAGAMTRPELKLSRVNFASLPVFFRASKLLRKGDDGLLRGLGEIIEAEGFLLVGAHELVTDLRAPLGVIAGKGPDQGESGYTNDLALARDAARSLGLADLGQAVVVRDGTIIAREGSAGTDAMLDGVKPQDTPSGFLFKAMKPQQEIRADMPAIGPDTIRSVAKAGLTAIIVEAGNCLLLDKAELVRSAEQAGILVLGVEAMRS